MASSTGIATMALSLIESAITGAIDQAITNGASLLGTLKAPTFQQWVPGSPTPGGTPWGTATTNNTNMYTNVPYTGVTRYYDWTVNRQMIAPDGVQINGFTVNGQYPGPTIEANWGDWIEVNVHNAMTGGGTEAEGTSLHWHGFLQTNTSYEDGVPGVSQCPIAPGQSYTYRFQASLYGTSWWHSHFSAQYASGLNGAIVVHGPSQVPYDIDLGPVLLNDWYHNPQGYYPYVQHTLQKTSDPTGVSNFVYSNNVLINGKNTYNCSLIQNQTCHPNAGLSKFQFTSGKSMRLRLANVGAESNQHFSIDNHTLTVIAYDFVPIQPYTTNQVTLGVGQRADVIVQGTGSPTGSYYMRSNEGPPYPAGCNNNDGLSNQALAVVYYQNANKNAIPTSTSDVPESSYTSCAGDPLASQVPAYPMNPDPNPPAVQTIDMTFINNGTTDLWAMNGSPFRTNYNSPNLLGAAGGNFTFPTDQNVYNFGSNSSVRIIFYNYSPASHPFHLHGHNFYILAEGLGTWNGQVQYPTNPPRRDTYLNQPGVIGASGLTPSYFVIQYEQGNPGVWPLHCHIAWHVSDGLYINVMDNPADIKNIGIPSSATQLCHSWAQWTGTNYVDQIDSGE